MTEIKNFFENNEELKSYCNINSVDFSYRDRNESLLLERINSIDENAEKERKILCCVAMFRLYEILGFKSLKSFLYSDYVTSKCVQECYKQINRAKFELMFHEGDFNTVGRMPSSHLDMFSLIPAVNKTSSELVARVKSVYNELYVEKCKGGTVTASLVKEHILEKFTEQKFSKKTPNTTHNNVAECSSKDPTLDWEEDDLKDPCQSDRDIIVTSSNVLDKGSSSKPFENLILTKEKLPALIEHLSNTLDNDGKIRLAFKLNQSLLDTGDVTLQLLLRDIRCKVKSKKDVLLKMIDYRKKLAS